MPSKGSAFTAARVKALAQEDPDVGVISKPAVAAIGRAAELFLRELSNGAAREATKAKAPSLMSEHLRVAKATDGTDLWCQTFVRDANASTSSSSCGASSSASSLPIVASKKRARNSGSVSAESRAMSDLKMSALPTGGGGAAGLRAALAGPSAGAAKSYAETTIDLGKQNSSHGEFLGSDPEEDDDYDA